MKKKGRGLSYDEKRQKMLKIFHNTIIQKTVYNYQQIQKLSIKAGIPFPSVKEILNSLKADDLIESQKIGAGVFFWSFPSKAYQIFKERIQTTQKQIDYFKIQNEILQQKIKQGQIGRQQTQQREQKQSQIKELLQQKRVLEKQIEQYIRFDPQRVELLKKQIFEKKIQINFWTDNLEQFKKYVKKQNPGIKDKQLQQQYGLQADMDYIQ